VTSGRSNANSQLLLGANQPIGVARGIYPGRVVWIWDSSSTNENCTNVFGDGWFLPKKHQHRCRARMLSDAVTRLTGRSTVAESWEALFRDFNQSEATATSDTPTAKDLHQNKPGECQRQYH